MSMSDINTTETRVFVNGEKQISRTEENWDALPQRLRGRGQFLLERGRIKDAELMFDAATEIDMRRASAPA